MAQVTIWTLSPDNETVSSSASPPVCPLVYKKSNSHRYLFTHSCNFIMAKTCKIQPLLHHKLGVCLRVLTVTMKKMNKAAVYISENCEVNCVVCVGTQTCDGCVLGVFRWVEVNMRVWHNSILNHF